MIKNIHDLKIIFFFFSPLLLFSEMPTITVSDLSPNTIEKLQTFSGLHKGEFIIHFYPPNSYGSMLTNAFNYPLKKIQSVVSAQGAVASIVSLILSFGWISYFLCGYLTYRVYRMIQKATSWSTWCSDDDLIKSDRDYLITLLSKRSVRHSRQNYISLMQELAAEEHLLNRYDALTIFLEKYNMLKFFPYVDKKNRSKAKKALEKIALARLLLAEAKCSE